MAADRAEAARVREMARVLMQRTTENGCTENEAMVAAAKLAELQDRYDLALEDVVTVEEIQQSFYTMGTRRTLLSDVTRAVAEYFDCKSWFETTRVAGEKQRQIVFLGRESDRTNAMWCMNMLRNMMRIEYEAWAEPRRKMGILQRTDRYDFEKAMTGRIRSRLVAAKADRNRAVVGERTGRDLMVVRTQAVTEALDALGMVFTKTRAAGRPASGDSPAYQAGRAAGDRVNFASPIAAEKRERIGEK